MKIFTPEYASIHKDLKFDPEPHEYIYQGERLDSLTQIMKMYLPDKYSKVNAAVMETARLNGKGIHAEINQFNISVKFPKNFIYFETEQFIRWMEKENLSRKYISSEIMICVPSSYCACTLDILIPSQGKIVEIKTTATKMIKEHSIQVAGQEFMTKLCVNFPIKERSILYLNSKGFEEIKIKKNDQAFGIWEQMLTHNKMRRMLENKVLNYLKK